MHDEQVTLIDLDDVRHGSTLQDLGRLMAFLAYRGCILGVSGPVLQKIGEVFMQQYEQTARWRIPRSALDWYVATSLINDSAYSCLTRLKTGTLEILDTLIQLATQISLGTGPWSQSRKRCVPMQPLRYE